MRIGRWTCGVSHSQRTMSVLQLVESLGSTRTEPLVRHPRVQEDSFRIYQCPLKMCSCLLWPLIDLIVIIPMIPQCPCGPPGSSQHIYEDSFLSPKIFYSVSFAGVFFFFLFLQGWGLFRTPSTSWEHNRKMLKQSGDDCTQLSSTVSEDPGPQPAGPEALWGFALHQMEVTSCSSTVSAWLLLRVWRLKRSGALCGFNLLKNVFSWNFSQTWLLL